MACPAHTARGETVAKATDEDWAYLIAEALAGQATCKGADELSASSTCCSPPACHRTTSRQATLARNPARGRLTTSSGVSVERPRRSPTPPPGPPACVYVSKPVLACPSHHGLAPGAALGWRSCRARAGLRRSGGTQDTPRGRSGLLRRLYTPQMATGCPWSVAAVACSAGSARHPRKGWGWGCQLGPCQRPFLSLHFVGIARRLPRRPNDGDACHPKAE